MSTRGASTSKRTAPQWQEPRWVVVVVVEVEELIVVAAASSSPAIFAHFRVVCSLFVVVRACVMKAPLSFFRKPRQEGGEDARLVNSKEHSNDESENKTDARASSAQTFFSSLGDDDDDDNSTFSRLHLRQVRCPSCPSTPAPEHARHASRSQGREKSSLP